MIALTLELDQKVKRLYTKNSLMAKLLRRDEKTKIINVELSLQSIYDIINGLNMLVCRSEEKIDEESHGIDYEIDVTKLERYRQLLKEFHKIKNDSISEDN